MKRTAEKNREIVQALKNHDAKAYIDDKGRRIVKKKAPNTEKKVVRRSFLGTRVLYNCPKCGKLLNFKKKMHQGLCMNCGQRLDWADYGEMNCVWLEIHDGEEAGYWADQYKKVNGALYKVDYESWRLSMTRRDYPALLYFPFPNGKDYGRFMRKAAKEATIVKNINKEE